MIVVDGDRIGGFSRPDHGNAPVAEPAIGPSEEQKAAGPSPEGLNDLGALHMLHQTLLWIFNATGGAAECGAGLVASALIPR
jgi:hypothetical protein